MAEVTILKSFPLLSSLSLAIASSLTAASAQSVTAQIPPLIAAQLDSIKAHARELWLHDRKNAEQWHPAGSFLPVTSCADDGQPGTLRNVVASALTGDTVDLRDVPCDTITLTRGYILDNYQVPSFSIQGPGMNALTISGANASGIFYHAGSGQLSISDISLADGYAEDSWGGCLLAPGGGFALTRVSVSGCEAHQVTMLHGSNAMGGGIMAFGEVDVVDSVVTGNTLSSEVPDASGYTDTLSGGGVFR